MIRLKKKELQFVYGIVVFKFYLNKLSDVNL